MKIKLQAKIGEGQDGAIFGGYLFRFDKNGVGRVYPMKEIAAGGEVSAIASFTLDRADVIAPHSNSVVFGCEYYSPTDEFPLLYSNIYNNYARSENPMIGTTLVYRIERDGEGFKSTLVQILEIGFKERGGPWLSRDTEDKRPYGNFVIDTTKKRLYAFVMRDGDGVTRYFELRLPEAREGARDALLGVPHFYFSREDIISEFDTPYHNFIQGAVFLGGRIFSVEGFGEKIHPALRVIDTEKRKEIFFADLYEMGAKAEAELIDFYVCECYYADAHGNVYILEFEDGDFE